MTLYSELLEAGGELLKIRAIVEQGMVWKKWDMIDDAIGNMAKLSRTMEHIIRLIHYESYSEIKEKLVKDLAKEEE